MASFSRINESPVPARRADNRVAYIRMLRSEDVGFIFPEAPLLAPGQNIFALVADDGTPLVLAESRESAMADAESYRLSTVSLH